MKTNSRIARNRMGGKTTKGYTKKSPSATGHFFKSSSMGIYTSAETSSFFQPKLTTGQPGDKYEREADAVADKVTAKENAGSIAQYPAISAVQKADLKEEKEPVQKAAEVKEEEKPVQKAEKKEEEKPIQKVEKEEEKPVQKEEEKKEEESVQKKASGVTHQNGAGFVSEQLHRRSSHGSPLPNGVRGQMEQSFGTSFDDVKIHADSRAEQMSKAIGAKAFTHGKDIYFNRGYFAPYSQSGKHLLAHELTHVVQQQGGKKSTAPDNHTVQREVELDAAKQPTGNYLFRTGADITPEFFRRFKQYVADGSLTDDELNTLRLYAVTHRGTVTQAERLLMAAGLDPATHPMIATHTTGPLSIPFAHITGDNRDHVNNIGRGTLSPEYEATFMRALTALLNGNFDEAAAEWANMNQMAIQEILTIGGTNWLNQAEGLVAFIEVHDINPVLVLNAMYNAASDSSSGDQVMAGIVYATAAHAGHSTAAQLASGTIKVDALIPSALQKLTNNSGVDAFYSPASRNDRIKSDTLYVPTSLDIMNLPARALIIHELNHATQDAAVTTPGTSPQIDMEIDSYRVQVKYVMDQLLGTPADALDMEVYSVRHLANMALFQWAFIVETIPDRARYEVIAKRILLQSSSVTEADVNNALGLTQATALQRLRNAILSMPQYSGNPNIARDGLKGESILDNVN